MRQVMLLIFLASSFLCLYLEHGKAEPVRAEMGPPLLAAKQALSAKDYAGALRRLDEAAALPDHTLAEDRIITQMRVITGLGAKSPDYAATAVTRAIDDKCLSDQEVQQFSIAIARGYYDAGTDTNAVIWLKRYLDSKGDPAAAQPLLLRATYRGGAWSEALQMASTAISGAEAHSARPAEDTLLIAADCANKLGTSEVYTAMTEKLAVYYSKPIYWSVLISAVAQSPDFPDKLALDITRLKLFTHVPLSAPQYTDAIERAVQAGFVGEASAMLEHGLSRGVLGVGSEAARHERLRKLVASTLAESKTLTDPGTTDTANAMAKQALALAGLGQRRAAIEMLETALKSNDLTVPTEARLHVGILYALDGNRDRAKQLFDDHTGNGPVAKLAHLWGLAVQVGG
jgi:hypothetical protein